MFESQVKNGLRDGIATQYALDGTILWQGQFKDGKPWEGTGFTESREILGKFVNGVIQ